MEDHPSSETTKLLVLGDSGSGKSGAICALADAGYNVRILDLDNGAAIVKNMFKAKGSPYKAESLKRIHYITMTDTYKFIGALPSATKATAWPESVAALSHWREELPRPKPQLGVPQPPKEYINDFGPISTWTSKEVLVIDSLTFLGRAAMNYVLSMQGRLGQHPTQQEWGIAQGKLEDVLAMLYDDEVKCNVVVLAHIQYTGGEEGALGKGVPVSLGKALTPKIGRYFNDVVMVSKTGIGKQEKRTLLTSSNISTGALIELKSSNPLEVRESYPLQTGLADYFRDVQGRK